MRRWLCVLLAVSVLSLSACETEKETVKEGKNPFEAVISQLQALPGGDPSEQPTEASTTQTTQPEVPTHSALFIPGVKTDDVIAWFNEVVLDAEFVNGGDATLVQKWNREFSYGVIGTPTAEDEQVLESMVATLNSMEGFPGMYAASDPANANLRIHFVSNDELMNILGDNFAGSDGGVTIWWDGNQQIYDGVICIRTDLDQYVRNSVIQEELYNGMGPLQDTDLRSDSLIYSGYSTPQQMTQVDHLIMQLLYHPDIRCGMTAAECENVIRQLYY